MTPGPRSVRSIAGRLEYRGFILDEPMRPPESAGPPDSKDREHYGGKTGGAGPGGTGAFFESIGLRPGRR